MNKYIAMILVVMVLLTASLFSVDAELNSVGKNPIQMEITDNPIPPGYGDTDNPIPKIKPRGQPTPIS